MTLVSRGRAFFTIDVEDWTADFPDLGGRGGRIAAPLERLLDLLAAHGSKATLFCLAEAARQAPALLHRAVAEGHRIGLHGLEHRLVYRQEPAAFEQALRDGRHILEDACGVAVTSHRAPCWSITRQSLWGLERLAAAGFEVDSSIFPTKNHLYGIPDAPVNAYEPVPGLIEIPPSVAPFAGMKLPFGGGFYLRALPLKLTTALFERTLRSGRDAVLYVHPWELDPEQPRDLPYQSWMARMIHYFRISDTERRLSVLMKRFGPFEAMPERAEDARRLVRHAKQLAGWQPSLTATPSGAGATSASEVTHV